MTYVMTLHAADLASKFGFNDGDEPDDVRDMSLDVDWHPVLIWLVRTHLLPLLPGVEVYEIISIHNPIRAVDPDRVRGSDVKVDLTLDDIVAAVATEQEVL